MGLKKDNYIIKSAGAIFQLDFFSKFKTRHDDAFVSYRCWLHHYRWNDLVKRYNNNSGYYAHAARAGKYTKYIIQYTYKHNGENYMDESVHSGNRNL